MNSEESKAKSGGFIALSYKYFLAIGAVLTILYGAYEFGASVHKSQVGALQQTIAEQQTRINDLSEELGKTQPNHATVKGRVTDVFGVPAQDAFILIGGDGFKDITDENGEFQIDKIPQRTKEYTFMIRRYLNEPYQDQLLLNKKTHEVNVYEFPYIRVNGKFTQDVDEESKEPIGKTWGNSQRIKAARFKKDRELFLHTRFYGVQKEDFVKHIWYYGRDKLGGGGKSLRVGPSPGWRTWSKWKIKPEQTGKWKVEVRTQKDRLIETFDFFVEK